MKSSYILRRPQNFAKSSPTFDLCSAVKGKVKISQNFAAFSEYNMNLNWLSLHWLFNQGNCSVRLGNKPSNFHNFLHVDMNDPDEFLNQSHLSKKFSIVNKYSYYFSGQVRFAQTPHLPQLPMPNHC